MPTVWALRNDRLVTRQFPMTICRSLLTPCSESFGSWSGRVIWVLLCATLLLWTPPYASAKSKPHRAPRPEPELKILDLNVSPNPYTVSSGPLQFSALVQLPKELDGATLLEVSSFITSPSKNSLRFLTARKPLDPHTASTNGAAPPHVSVLLTWDGWIRRKPRRERDSITTKCGPSCWRTARKVPGRRWLPGRNVER